MAKPPKDYLKNIYTIFSFKGQRAPLALLLITMYINARGIAFVGTVELVLLLLNNLYRITMVFLFTFFAYDSAKHQLKKANLSK